jgi:hypothetical protein
MFKLHYFFKNKSKGMHKVILLISKKLYNKNMPPSMKAYVHYEFDEKPNYTKLSKFLTFEGKGYKENDFFLPFDKTLTKNCVQWVQCLP